MRFKDRRGVIFVSGGRGYQRETPKPKHITGTDKERGPRGGRYRKRREAVQQVISDYVDALMVPSPVFKALMGEAQGEQGEGNGNS